MEQVFEQLPLLLTAPAYPWLFEQAEKAFQQWQTLPLPEIERVKYHRWPLFQDAGIAIETQLDPLGYSLAASLAINDQETASIVHVGYEVMAESMTPDASEQGLIVMNLAEAIEQHEALVAEHLFSVVDPLSDRLTAFNTAHLDGGIFVYVPRNMEVTLPINAQFVQDSRFNTAYHKHILIVAEENSRVNYMEQFTTYGEAANSATVVVEVVAKAGSHIKYSAVDTFGKKTHAYIKRHARVERDAKVEWAIGCLNDGNVILDLDTQLVGDGSHGEVQVVGISNEKQIQAVDTKVVNQGKHSVGNILQHGVILDRATLTFNGIGLIEKYAKGADAQQESRILMLSEKARGDANPILLIEEFEVTAGHAASVGQVDEEQLYYLMSRGLSRQQAEHLVVRGFLGPVIVQMPTSEIRQTLVSIIDQKLQNLQ